MLSDSDDTSDQDYSDIDYHIDLLERRLSAKHDRYWKRKRQYPPYPMSTRKLQAHAVLLKVACKRYTQESTVEHKSFGQQQFSSTANTFQCDEEFLNKPADAECKRRSKSSKKLASTDLTKFSRFREQFYQKHHGNIKSSLNNRSNTKIVNIRLAPVHESVQIQFIKRLNEQSNALPTLVYHGTKGERIQSILRYGLLVPNQAHPTIMDAPIIQSINGQAYGQGIYCSRTAHYSLSYASLTNTLLVCAAIPNNDQMDKVQYSNGHILVLPHVSQVVPLFLMDLNGLDCTYPWHSSDKTLDTNRVPREKQPIPIPKCISQKILSCINSRFRKTQRYQIRSFD